MKGIAKRIKATLFIGLFKLLDRLSKLFERLSNTIKENLKKLLIF
jgi:hypothetical protein